MYQLFAMKHDARLYVLGDVGWVRGNGLVFRFVEEVWAFLYESIVPDVGDLADSYIAEVDADGMIIRTMPVFAECRG